MPMVSDIRNRAFTWLALALLLLTASCASNSADGLAGPVNSEQQRLLPLGSPLPSLPSDLDRRSTEPSRTPSALQDYIGADFLLASGGTVQGDSLVLQSTEDHVAWAMYRASDLQGLRVNHFGVNALPGAPGQSYHVGVSNFSDGVWEYFISSSLPEAEIDLTANTKRLTSFLGNLYYVVIVSNGDAVHFERGYLDVSAGGGWAPGAPQQLIASQDLKEYIALHWLPSADADSYEVSRRSGPAQWEIVGFSEGPSYKDYDVIVDQEYEYRVQANNDFGESGHSGMAMGMCSQFGGGSWGDCMAVGPIQALDELSVTIDGMIFLHDSMTGWFGKTGELLSWTDFVVGDYVWAQGDKDAAGNCVADSIVMSSEDNRENNFSTYGYLEAIDDDSLRIDGVTYAHNEQTQWWFNGKVSTRDTLVIGGIAAVNGLNLADGTQLAETVDQWNDGIEEFTRQGQIEALDAESITVDGEVYLHDSATLWSDFGGEETDWTGLNVGEFVWISGAYDGGGPALLTSVAQKAESQTVTGVITDVGSGPLEVDGEVYYPHFWTVWIDAAGNEASVDDFAIGDTVRVHIRIADEIAWADNVYMLNDV